MKKILNSKLLLYIPLLLIVVISFFNMYNAQFINSIYNHHLIKQITWIFIAIILFIIIKQFNNFTLFKLSNYLYYFSLSLLILVLIIGKNINGAKAWLNIGNISFQPSEIMKLCLNMYLISIISNNKINNSKYEIILIIKVLIITIIPSIFVFLEPDTGAIIFYILIALTCLYHANINKKWFFYLIILTIILIASFIIIYLTNQDLLIKLIGTSFFYRVERLITFHTENSYQLENAIIAIGSSSLYGSGFNHVSLYIPEAPTDFIFAFNISNFGYLSGLIVIVCYFAINLFLINKYHKIKDKKIKLLLSSFINILLLHEVINIGMNLGLLPIIGIPLPFLSYGGSTIIIYSIYLSIIDKGINNMDIP